MGLFFWKKTLVFLVTIFFWTNFFLKANSSLNTGSCSKHCTLPQVSKTHVLEDRSRTLLLKQNKCLARVSRTQGLARVSRKKVSREKLYLRGPYGVPTRPGVSRRVSLGSRERRCLAKSCSYGVPTGSLRAQGSRKGSRKGLARSRSFSQLHPSRESRSFS